MKLLIDVGNTRLKWAALDADALCSNGVFAHTGQPLSAKLQREWAGLACVDAVFIASVVSPAHEEELAACVQERFGVSARFLRSPPYALGIRNAYAQPQRLGVDRFLALAALHAAKPCAQVLVSVGTALTLDALCADGAHLGGVILAGPRMMRDALLAGTARINVADGRCVDLPVDTADAVMTGSLYAAAGAIDRFRAAVARRLGVQPALFLTGGGADELEPLLAPIERAHDLVLRGLALWAQASAGVGKPVA
ncbi:MAG: type III pantothenate kinase [Rhodanobacter sp.]|jgi:type III pantothenate kinase|nr:type III pantothenate kinase [Rhodanobacter sp.]